MMENKNQDTKNSSIHKIAPCIHKMVGITHEKISDDLSGKHESGMIHILTTEF